jgi:hypothetical protein
MIQLALGLAEVTAMHSGEDDRNETLAPAFGYLAHDLGFDPEVYGLGEHAGPHLMAAARMT